MVCAPLLPDPTDPLTWEDALLPAAGTLLAGAGQIGANYYNMVYRKTV